MKAKDLKELLDKVDPESNVFFSMADGCCGDYLELDISDSEILDYGPKENHFVRVHFNAVPGYRSCIQAGGTKRAHEAYWQERNPRVLDEEKKSSDEN